ncbi:MAG: Peptide deformylase 1 [Myxococcota bacterium]|nr:Peptide deformylase 1 [Myxococcota bacterium]
MALLEVLKWPDPRLKEIAKPIREITPEIRKLAEDMAETMYAAEGIGLAAVQVGAPVRMIVIDPAREGEAPRLQTCLNPEITGGEGEAVYSEGCLSVPEVREEVKRFARIKVRYMDLEGKTREEDINMQEHGVLPIVFQHEIDHLNGIVFVEYLSRLKREFIKRKMRSVQAFNPNRPSEKVA